MHQDFTGPRIHDQRSAVEPGLAEPVLRGLLQVVVDGELDPSAFGGSLFVDLVDFAPQAVDDDAPRAVGAHQDGVVDLLDAEFSDDGVA